MNEGTFVKKQQRKCSYYNTIGVFTLPQGGADPSAAAQEITLKK